MTNPQLKLAVEDFEVEYELVPVEVDERRIAVYDGINKIEEMLDANLQKIEELNSDIDRLTNHADGLDYTVAVASGIIAGIIDSFWVGEFSLDRANKWGDKKVNDFVMKIAKKQGYEGDDLSKAIKHLEDKYEIAADKATNAFGGGLQHHLRDFSHHPTPVGLIFSMLTQFTEKVYGTDVAGVFKIVPVDASTLIGKNLPEKITFGLINWFFHMVSDMAGSSTSVGNGSAGTGLPGPIVSFLKEISALPIFRNMNKDGYKEFSVWISKLFNGTLLGKRDENGKLIEAVKFDLRTEIGVAHEIGRQAVPVIVNECVVRGFYFLRRLFAELKNNKIKSIADLKNINWKSTLPFKNRTIVRMLTIATGTFTAFDTADALIRAAIETGGFNAATAGKFILRVNFVGIGRFAIAVVTDVAMGIKRSNKRAELSEALSEYFSLTNIKIYYRKADLMCSFAEMYDKEAEMHTAEKEVWIEARNASLALEQMYEQIGKTCMVYKETVAEMDKCLNDIAALMPGIDEKNPGLREKLLARL